MTKEIIKLSDLNSIFESGLKSLKFSEKWKKSLLACIVNLVCYMEMNCLNVYANSVGVAFIAQLINKSEKARWLYRHAVCLLESFIGGEGYGLRIPKVAYLFPGDIGVSCEHFIEEESVSGRFSQGTVQNYASALSRFSVEMEIRQIHLKTFGRQDVIRFISSAQNMSANIYIPLRRFLKYLYDKGMIETDFSLLLQDLKQSRRSQLPAVYSTEEIARLEASVDRGSAVGKRNYAMLLLASRLGLRASDIVNLEFSNLDWENKKLGLVQVKTGRPVELPLLSDVGDGMIDYLLHGRPQTKLKKVFVTANNPVRPLSPSMICTIVTRQFSEAGIALNGRRHGGHALRHSPATAILGNNVGLPVIAGVLGHASTESAMVYLGVDIQMLKGCSLEVPPVDQNFYMQRGGIFLCDEINL
jgi:site-specific recombinase XerD